MPIGLGSGLWAYVAPIDEINIATNPSFEFGNAGVTAIQSATLGTTSQFQRYGAWSLKVTPAANGTSGAILGTWTAAAAGTAYSVSVWAFVESGVPMRLAVGDGNGVNLVGSVAFTGGGTWQWYNTDVISGAGGTFSAVLQKTSGNSQLPYYADGLMINPWTDALPRVTTYFDGDTNGGTWLGAQQQSPSFRSGQYRGGGSIIALADLGLNVDQMVGVGVPPIEVSSQSFAVTDGAQFQRQRAGQRKFSLTAKPIVGTSLADFHNVRRTIFDAFKPDLTTAQQPVRFLYYGAQGTQQIDAYYEKGLELGNMDGVIAENAAISFVATDPYFYAPTQQGTTLPARVFLGSVNYMARRSPLGQWGTMGQTSGTTLQASGAIPTAIRTFAVNSGGTVFFGGGFGTLAGTRSPHLGMYFPQTNLFGTLQGGTMTLVEGPILATALNPSGTLFFGGAFSTVAGTAANGLGRWSGAFGTLQGGTMVASGFPRTLLYSPLGTLFFGGAFNTVQGTANSRNIAMWTGAFGTLGGTANVDVEALAWGLDNRLFIGGLFTNIGGTVGTSIGFWKNGTFGTMNSIPATNWGVTSLGVGPSGQLYEGGDFVLAGGGSALRSAVWNGVQHAPLGAGLGGESWALKVDQTTGNVIYGGAFLSAGSIAAPANYAVWNGAAWLLPDIGFTNNGFTGGTVFAILQTPDNTLYIGGDFVGTTYAAAVGTIINTGRAAVYPTMRIRNLGAGTARIYQLLNTTTGNGIYFNYTMLPSEQAVLTLQPGQRSFQSSAQGNIFGMILPGSNLATFNLLPGTNYISYFSDGGTVETSFFWQPRGWSADSGTTF
jgi:hypothetical protein